MFAWRAATDTSSRFSIFSLVTSWSRSYGYPRPTSENRKKKSICRANDESLLKTYVGCPILKDNNVACCKYLFWLIHHKVQYSLVSAFGQRHAILSQIFSNTMQPPWRQSPMHDSISPAGKRSGQTIQSNGGNATSILCRGTPTRLGQILEATRLFQA